MAGLEGKSVEDIEALAELANTLATNPKTRRGFLSLTKQANPDAAIPEIDIPNQFGSMLAEPLKRLEDIETKAQERDLRDKIESRRRELGVSDEELTKIEKVMVDNGIADHKTAKKFMDMESRQVEPSAASALPGLRRFSSLLPDMSKITGDPKQHSYGTAYAVIDELRGRKAH